MNKSTQHIDKAIVYVGPECRVYVPYSGNLTKAKKEQAVESVKAYREKKNIVVNGGGWKATDIKITTTQGQFYKSYTETGAGGSNDVYVCNIEFAKYNE